MKFWLRLCHYIEMEQLNKTLKDPQIKNENVV